MGRVILLRADCPHKEWECRTAAITLKALKASADEMEETEHTTTVSHVLHQSKRYGRARERYY